MKAMSKSQLAAAAGVSIKTFQRWLVRHSEELALLGVKPARQTPATGGCEVHSRAVLHRPVNHNGQKRTETDNATRKCRNFATETKSRVTVR